MVGDHPFPQQHIVHRQVIAFRAGHPLLDEPQHTGAGKGEYKIDHHRNGVGREERIGGTGDAAHIVEQLGNTDDGQHAGVLDVDNQVVANLGHDVAQCLGKDHMEHGLGVVHSDGHGALGLAGIDGQDAAANRLCHIGTSIDRDDKDRRKPGAHVDIKEHSRAIVDECRLHHHRSTAKNFHVGAEHRLDGVYKRPFAWILLPVSGNGLDNADDKSDQAADSGGDKRDHHCFESAVGQQAAVLLQDIGDPAEEIVGIRQRHI